MEYNMKSIKISNLNKQCLFIGLISAIFSCGTSFGQVIPQPCGSVEFELIKNERWDANLGLPEVGILSMLEKAGQNCELKENGDFLVYTDIWVDSINEIVAETIRVNSKEITRVLLNANYDKSILIELTVTLYFRDQIFGFPDWSGFGGIPILAYERDFGENTRTKMFENAIHHMIDNKDLLQISQSFCKDSEAQLFQFQTNKKYQNARILLFSPECIPSHIELINVAVKNLVSENLTAQSEKELLKIYQLEAHGSEYNMLEINNDDPLKNTLFNWKLESTIPLADEDGYPLFRIDSTGIMEYVYGSPYYTPKGRAAMNHINLLEIQEGNRTQTYFSFMEFANESPFSVPWFSLDEYAHNDPKNEFISALRKTKQNGFQTYQMNVLSH